MENKPKFVTHFIELYRSLPCLWKVTDPGYRNKRLRNECYEKLLEYYKTVESTANVDTVRQKINNLKCAFRKELKKVNSDEYYVSKLWYFDLLMFTADQIVPNNRTTSDSKIDEKETFCDEDSRTSSPSNTYAAQSPPPSHSSFAGVPGSSQTESSKVIKRKKTLINEACKALKSLKEDDEYDGIGLNVACKLRRMDEGQRLYAEFLINKVLLNGIRHRLQDDTDITGLTETVVVRAEDFDERGDLSQYVVLK